MQRYVSRGRVGGVTRVTRGRQEAVAAALAIAPNPATPKAPGLPLPSCAHMEPLDSLPRRGASGCEVGGSSTWTLGLMFVCLLHGFGPSAHLAHRPHIAQGHSAAVQATGEESENKISLPRTHPPREVARSCSKNTGVRVLRAGVRCGAGGGEGL